MSGEPEPHSPASFISGVKVCEDVTRNGFSCPSVVDLLCVVTLWPLALVYPAPQSNAGHLMGRSGTPDGEE